MAAAGTAIVAKQGTDTVGANAAVSVTAIAYHY